MTSAIMRIGWVFWSALLTGLGGCGGRGPLDEALPQAEPSVAPVPGCSLGDTRCDGAMFLRCVCTAPHLLLVNSCRESTEWRTARNCLVAQSCDPASGCVPPDVARCAGAELEGYDANTGDWELAEICSGASFCNAEARACTEAPCQPGQVRCNDGAVERCREDRVDWDVREVCASAGLCDASTASCRRP